MLRKTFVFCVFLLLFIVLSSFAKNNVYAGCSIKAYDINDSEIKDLDYNFNGQVTIKSSIDCFQTGVNYWVIAHPKILSLDKAFEPGPPRKQPPLQRVQASDTKTVSANLNFNNELIIGKDYPGAWEIVVCLPADLPDSCKDINRILASGDINILSDQQSNNQTQIPKVDIDAQEQCVFQVGSPVTIDKITVVDPNTEYKWWWDGAWTGIRIDKQGKTEFSYTLPEKVNGEKVNDRIGNRKLCFLKIDGDILGAPCGENGITLKFTAGPPKDPSCFSKEIGNDFIQPPPCSQWVDENGKPIPLGNPKLRDKKFFAKCAVVTTAIGDIGTLPEDFVQKLLAIILSLSGGIALLLIIFSGYKLMTSQGNPEKLQGARETLTSAIVGLLLIIFSLVIIELIGVDILHIPGFSR